MRNKERKQKDANAYTWKDGLLEGLAEILVYLIAFAIGAVFLLLVSKGNIPGDIPADFILLIGFILSIIPAIIVIFVVYLVKKSLGRKKIKYIYKTLKSQYNVSTVVLTRKMHGEYKDVYILRGKSQKGSFELYRDGEKLVFTAIGVEEMRLDTVDEAISEIEKFMSENKEEKNN